MQPRRRIIGPALATLAGLGLLGLAFVPAWLDHYRILLGEGPRRVHVALTAWQGLAMPVIGVAVVLVALAALTGLGSLWARPGAGRSWPGTAVAAFAALAGLALLIGSVPPVAQQGHASGVTISAEWALAAGIGLAVVTLAGVLAPAMPSGRVLAVGVVGLVVIGAGTWGGRQLQLDLVEGNGQNWSPGSYTRAAVAGQPAETMTLQGSRFTVGDRWASSFEPSGRVISLSGDPACPKARGSYHVDATPDGGITWERIVDTCANGARSADLTTGVWQRVH